jgi:hypothetical protein
MTSGLAASVRARLLNFAKERGEDFSLVLSRYAVERFLYRLSVSPDRDRYWLKGRCYWICGLTCRTGRRVMPIFLASGRRTRKP